MTNIIEQMRRIDDAKLDAYQRSLMFHYLRVGHCWESLRTTAKKTGMSLGKAKQVRDWLVENGWVKWEPASNGRMSIVIVERSPHEQAQQLERSQDEQRSPHEQGCSPHELHLKEPLEENTTKRPHDELSSHFLKLTGIDRPHSSTDFWQDRWERPFDIWLERYKTVERVKGVMGKAVQMHIDKGWKYSSPKSLMKTIANSHANTPKQSRNGHSNGANSKTEQAWLEITREVGKSGRPEFSDRAILKAINKLPGGWSSFKSHNFKFINQLKPGFIHEYERQFATPAQH